MDPSSEPALPDDVRRAIEVFGSEARSGIVRALGSGPMNFGALLESTSLPAPTLARNLKAMEQLDVLVLDLPEGKRRGRSVNYSLRGEAISTLGRSWMQYVLGGDESLT